MGTRRDLLTGLAGACAGVVCWTVGERVAEDLSTTTVRYVLVRNETGNRQSLKLLFESDGTPVFWETYDLESGQVVELDRFERTGTYRLFVRWGERSASERLESGERAVAVVLAPVGDGDVLIRDVPFSSLSPAQRTVNSS